MKFFSRLILTYSRRRAHPGSALIGPRLRRRRAVPTVEMSFPGPEMRAIQVPAMRGNRHAARSHRRCADA
jgi:hypothetical protein